jgi:hypothetical protein
MCVISCAMQEKFHSFHPVAVLLSYLTKAPLVITGPLPLLLASLLVIKENVQTFAFLAWNVTHFVKQFWRS